jgi:hypothetical protein
VLWPEITLEGAHLHIGFDASSGGLSLLEGNPDGRSFIAREERNYPCWELKLRSTDGSEESVSSIRGSEHVIHGGADTIIVEWKGVSVKDEKDVLDVRVDCTLDGRSDTALLSISVDNRSTKYGLWEVHFPIIANLGSPNDCDIAIGRGTWGMLYKNPKERIEGEYPSGNMPIQMMLIQRGDEGLYLAAHDPNAMYKRFACELGKEFRVITRAADMGVPGNDWQAPYPFAVGVYRGSWMEGCKHYRAWAIENAPWTKKGPLAKRTDVPEHMKNMTAWLLANGTAGEVVPVVRQFAERVGAPVGVHWYNWHEIPFDVHYPDYFPTKPGFAEGVKELTAAGVTVMPYINSRLWDTSNEDFAAAKPGATKDEVGNVNIEEYGSGAKLAVMCPTQAIWQNKIAEIIHRLGDECGVNAVYLDQIGAAPPRVCFDTAHQHTLGSGDWWVGGYRNLLTPIKQWCVAPERTIGLTTENNAEPYMDNVDAHLIWTPRSDSDIPMNTAIYSGYTTYFASNRAFDFGDVSYCVCQARDFTWGAQLGWDGPGILQPDHEAKLTFVARLSQLRSKALDYVVYGELLDVLTSESPNPDLNGKWNTPSGDAPVTLKAVHAALWRSVNGDAGILVANADTEAHTFTCSTDLARYGFSAAKWHVESVTNAETKAVGDQEGGTVHIAVDVPGRDAVLIKVVPGQG